MIEGHCFCGFVRFQADGPVSHQTCCHCSTCRRISAAPLVAWLTVPRAKFRIVSGEPTSFRSSARVTRSFCPRCGTPLTYANDAADDEIDITIGSLDEPERMPPLDHSRVSAQLPWLKLCDGLPNYAEARTKQACS
ncbi:MAG TPA: GFA family protein [Polyangiaceae bacterium]